MKNFKERIKEHLQKKYDISSDNLAVPEIRTHKDESKGNGTEDAKSQHPPITYDSVAIPEIHIKKKK